jgi:hypothetical protein
MLVVDETEAKMMGVSGKIPNSSIRVDSADGPEKTGPEKLGHELSAVLCV